LEGLWVAYVIFDPAYGAHHAPCGTYDFCLLPHHVYLACNLYTHQIVVEGEDGDYFYIIKEGEAEVHQSTAGGQRRKVNHLFRADFFGERALLVKEPRIATVSRLLSWTEHCCMPVRIKHRVLLAHVPL
jgi:CRP-like cAMP-binding protein